MLNSSITSAAYKVRSHVRTDINVPAYPTSSAGWGYLTRPLGASASQRKFTISCLFLQPGASSASVVILSTGNANPATDYAMIRLITGGIQVINVTSSTTRGYLFDYGSTLVPDDGNWHHLLIAVDTAAADVADRCVCIYDTTTLSMYTTVGSGAFTQNQDLEFGKAQAHYINTIPFGSGFAQLSALAIADYYYLDGVATSTALGADFLLESALSIPPGGGSLPKKYRGSWGTSEESSFLQFNSSTNIGLDSGPFGNDWDDLGSSDPAVNARQCTIESTLNTVTPVPYPE